MSKYIEVSSEILRRQLLLLKQISKIFQIVVLQQRIFVNFGTSLWIVHCLAKESLVLFDFCLADEQFKTLCRRRWFRWEFSLEL